MLQTIIIDDEPRAIEVIKGFIDKVSFLELNESFRDPVDAIEYLQNEKCDLIFLDINMPKLNGIEFIDTLENKPKIIFTTAYSEYAVESYEYGVVDYLLKPIKFNRFLKAVTKVNILTENKGTRSINSSEPRTSSGTTIFVKSGPQTYKINTNDIQYLEKDGNYLIFHTSDKKILSRQSMGDVFEVLDKSEFIRIHKSYIVPIKKINVIERHQVKIGKVEIPIGRTYKDSFFSFLKLDEE